MKNTNHGWLDKFKNKRPPWKTVFYKAALQSIGSGVITKNIKSNITAKSKAQVPNPDLKATRTRSWEATAFS